MSDDKKAIVDDAIQLFIHGAKTLLAGYYLDIRAMDRKGLAIINKAAAIIDASSPTGRDPLLTLLDDPCEMVRTVAAGGLWQSHTALARKVIEEVDQRGITEASGLAMKILMFHGRFNPVCSDPRYEGLHEDENGVDMWLKPGFTDRVMSGELPSTFALRTDIAAARQASTKS